MKQKSIVINTIMNIILTASSFIFPLITFPYVSRVLGVEGNGKISFVYSVISYFTMLAALGIPVYGIRACAKCRDNKKELSTTVHELLAINLITTICSYCILIVLMQIVPQFQKERTLFIIMSVSIALNSLGMEWLYKALEDYKYITIRSIMAKIISLVCMFLFVKNESDYCIYGALTILSSSGSYLLNIFNARKYIDWKIQEKYDLKRHMKPIMVLFGASIATSLYGHMDATMLGFIHGDYQNGLYNASTKIKGVLISIASALTTVLLPRMSYCIGNHDYVAIRKHIQNAVTYVSFVVFPMVIFCICNAADCMVFLAGEGYRPAQGAFIVHSLCVVIISFSSIFSNQILIPFGEDKKNFNAISVGVFVNFVANLILIPKYGALGASIATLMTEAAVSVKLYQAVKRTIEYNLDLKDISKYIFSSIFAGIVSVIASYFMSTQILFVKLMISGVSFVFVYVAFLFVFKEDVVYNFYRVGCAKFRSKRGD